MPTGVLNPVAMGVSVKASAPPGASAASAAATANCENRFFMISPCLKRATPRLIAFSARRSQFNFGNSIENGECEISNAHPQNRSHLEHQPLGRLQPVLHGDQELHRLAPVHHAVI